MTSWKPKKLWQIKNLNCDNSNSEQTQIVNVTTENLKFGPDQNSEKTWKLKFQENSRTQVVTKKLTDKAQKLKLWQNLKSKISKKKNLKCDKTKKNQNCDKTPISYCAKTLYSKTLIATKVKN